MARNNNFGLLYALSLAWELGFFIAVPIGGFIFLGFLGDKFLGTRPIFLIVGVVIGAIIACYGAYRSLIFAIKSMEEGGREKEDEGKTENRHL